MPIEYRAVCPRTLQNIQGKTRWLPDILFPRPILENTFHQKREDLFGILVVVTEYPAINLENIPGFPLNDPILG